MSQLLKLLQESDELIEKKKKKLKTSQLASKIQRAQRLCGWKRNCLSADQWCILTKMAFIFFLTKLYRGFFLILGLLPPFPQGFQFRKLSTVNSFSALLKCKYSPSLLPVLQSRKVFLMESLGKKKKKIQINSFTKETESQMQKTSLWLPGKRVEREKFGDWD